MRMIRSRNTWSVMGIAILGAVLLWVQSGGPPAHAAAASATVWVANTGSNDVSVIDTTDNSLAAQIPVGAVPHNVSVSKTGDFAYAANSGDGTVSVINLGTYEVVNTLQVGEGPHDVAVDSTGRWGFVSNQKSNDVSIVDLKHQVVVKTVPVGLMPGHTTMTPDGNQAFVANGGSGSISIIDVDQQRVLSEIPVGKGVHNVAFTPNGEKAFITLIGENAVAVVDTKTQRVVGKIPVGRAPHNLGVDSKGRVWVPNTASNIVTVIDAQGNNVIKNVDLGSDAHGVAVDGSYAYVSSMKTGTLSIVDQTTGKIVQVLAVGKGSDGVRIGPPVPPNYTRKTEPVQTQVNSETLQPVDAGTVVIRMQDLRYQLDESATTVEGVQVLNADPLELRIPRGTKVVFVNKDPFEHNVVHATPENLADFHDKSAFHSPEFMKQGETFSYRFEQDGTYPILCMVAGHYLAGMTGTIVVGDSGDVENANVDNHNH